MKKLRVMVRFAGIPLWAALAFAPSNVLAHEEAVLRSTRSSVAAGDTLPVGGADFSPGVTYALRLVGALREFELRSFEGGADGRVELIIPIPRGVSPGDYKLVAIAPDGDRVASLDLTVLEPPAVHGDTANAGSDPGHAEMEKEARAGEMRIERSRSGAEWGAIGLIIGLAAGVGFMLIRRS